MVSFKVNDDAPGFIPIKVSQTASDANAVKDNGDADPQFQKILSELLQNWSGSADAKGTDVDALAALMGNLQNSNNNPSALTQLLQSSLLSPDQSQAGDPLTAFANAQMIAQYKLAMVNFQKAMQTSPQALSGISPDTLNRALNNALRSVQEGSGAFTGTPGTNPSKEQVAGYISDECRKVGLPEQLGLATAMTESEMTQFKKDGTPFGHSNSDSSDWGIMQVNDKAWGNQYDVNLLKTDWQYNVRAGLQILKHSYDAAIKSSEGTKGPYDANQNLAQAAYSGYNAGAANIWRYRTPIQDTSRTGLYDVIDNQGYDIRDVRFLDNYRKFF